MIKLETHEDIAELFVYGAIGDPWDGILAKDVADALKRSSSSKEILVRINSEGGIAFDGIAIMNLLRSAPQTITVVVDGLAASAASIVAMAGDTITIGSGAMMMIHEPWGFVMGPSADMRQTADILDSITDQVAGIYASRGNGSVDDFKALMAAETWLSADQAVELGLADEVVDQELVAAKWDLSKFSKVPKSLSPHSQSRRPTMGHQRSPGGPTSTQKPLGMDLREYYQQRVRLLRARSGV